MLTMLGALACLTVGCGESFTSASDGDAGSERGSPGGAVAPTFGAISTIGPASGDASAADSSGSGGLMLTDDGFEMGEAKCSGNVCVQGNVRP